MKILILDQCSGLKDYPDEVAPFEKDVLDDHSLQELLAREDSCGIAAQDLYAGRQQQKINQAVRILRTNGHEVDRYFISAGFGLIEEQQELPPYDVTFSGMSKSAIETRADRLGIPTAVWELLTSEAGYDVVFLALGTDYYHSIDLESTLETLPATSFGIVFNNEELAAQFSNVISISARTPEAKQHGTIVVALKGVYLKNFAQKLGLDDGVPTPSTIRAYCTSEDASQAGFDQFG